jgi:peptidoglycan-N-acetylglucosamine deacetylase
LPKVTLTFDNGPDPNVTPYVLDCLARHDVKTTFFVIGRRVAEPDRAAAAHEAVKAGHRVGNHTWSHTVPLGELDAEAALREFDQAEQALEWLEQPERLFRPYGRGGKLGPHLLHPAVIPRLDTCVLWKFVSGDWRDPDGWMPRALADCRASDWSLVVLHDIPSGAMLHLDAFITTLKREGMELTQEYPPDCVPIRQGKILMPLDPYCSSGIFK